MVNKKIGSVHNKSFVIKIRIYGILAFTGTRIGNRYTIGFRCYFHSKNIIYIKANILLKKRVFLSNIVLTMSAILPTIGSLNIFAIYNFNLGDLAVVNSNAYLNAIFSSFRSIRVSIAVFAGHSLRLAAFVVAVIGASCKCGYAENCYNTCYKADNGLFDAFHDLSPFFTKKFFQYKYRVKCLTLLFPFLRQYYTALSRTKSSMWQRNKYFFND